MKFEKNIIVNGNKFDYKLEDGTLLHWSEWNGEVYTVKENGIERTFKPIYAEEENENGGFDIVDFEEQ